MQISRLCEIWQFCGKNDILSIPIELKFESKIICTYVRHLIMMSVSNPRTPNSVSIKQFLVLNSWKHYSVTYGKKMATSCDYLTKFIEI